MLRSVIGLIYITTTLILTACTGTNDAEQTLIAQHEARSTQFANLNITATAEGERLLITVEYMQTRVMRATAQQGDMISTLQARGTEIIDVPEALTLPPPPTITPTSESEATIPPDVVTAAIDPARIQVTPFTITPTATPTLDISGEPLHLQEITMAAGVGPDDCALDIINRFSPDAERIYIVARAVDVASGTVMSSRWLRGDEEVAVFHFTRDFHIETACIWFFADQTDFEFIPGEYEIILELNGVPAAQPIPFTITNPA